MKKNRLHNIKTTGYKMPDNYLDSFEDKLLNQLSQKETIEGIDVPGFKVPDGYFKSVDSKVLSKVNSENRSVIHLFAQKNFYYVAGIAASLLLLFAIYINVEKPEELTFEMVETYFENSDLDSYELAELLTDAELLEEDFTITEASFSEDNLESYLLNNADIETILD